MRVAALLLTAALTVGLEGAANGGTADRDGSAAIHAAKRQCRDFFWRGARYKLVVNRGHVSCRKAGRVLRRFLAGHGVHHGHGPLANQYWTLGRWRCGRAAGGGGCIRGGSSFRNAREYITTWIA